MPNPPPPKGTKPQTHSAPQLGPRPQRPEGMKAAPVRAGGKISAAPAQLGGDNLQTVVTRNKFYREGYQHLMKIAIAQGLVVVVLAFLVVYKMFIEPPPVRYFATSNDGRIIDLKPLSDPSMTDATVLSWVSQAAANVMTFSFLDYRVRLQQSAEYFTPVGWNGFMKAIQDSRFLEGVKVQQQIITAVPAAAPVIVDRKKPDEAGDRFYWRIQLPMIVTYTSGEKTASKRQLLNLIVVRVSPLENPAALGIEQWVASDLR
ncbi:MAG TPA: type IVB secretion system apparatus protein IcmL/DotI [Alphaproteobacteria bacterium]|nr:type IV secretion protein IcmL [Rhodospirillaceae bacterium]HRJ12010.1 type IVB secretion system apparatus protein IcmL/DotI [Alphaproteobacteria bacterium]